VRAPGCGLPLAGSHGRGCRDGGHWRGLWLNGGGGLAAVGHVYVLLPWGPRVSDMDHFIAPRKQAK
jgi:hypothetical protein